MNDLSVNHPDVEKDISNIMEKGNVLQDENKFKEALACYEKAWSLLPPPEKSWNISYWISSCFFDLYFNVEKNFEKAKYWAKISLETRDSDIDTAPLIDLGMVYFEIKDYEKSYEYFDKAYSYGKRRAFKDRPKKYLDFYLEKTK